MSADDRSADTVVRFERSSTLGRIGTTHALSPVRVRVPVTVFRLITDSRKTAVLLHPFVRVRVRVRVARARGASRARGACRAASSDHPSRHILVSIDTILTNSRLPCSARIDSISATMTHTSISAPHSMADPRAIA